MGAWLIELISNFVDITGNPTIDTVIFLFIGIISGLIAFGLVGFISKITGNYNSRSMSDLHWSIRFILFAAMTYLFVLIARAIKWVFTPPGLYYLIGVVVIIISVICILIFKKPVNEEADELMEDETESVKIEETVKDNPINKNVNKCPYCGGLLVERQGPYGNFLGCSNFPNCKYTRNYNLGGRND